MLRCPSAIAVALFAAAAGCTKLPKNTSLLPATPVPDHAALEVFFVRVPLGEKAVIGPLWSVVDEQAISLDVRRRLTANGFLVGQIGGQLPAAVTDLLKISDDAPTLNAAQPATLDFTKPTPVHRKRIDVYQPNTPNRIIVTGERQRHEKLQVMLCDEADDRPLVCGWTFPNAQGTLLTKVHPQPDGRVKLDLVPEIEYGEPRRQITPLDGGALSMIQTPPHKTFDGLRVSASLSPGEMLILSCQGDRPGSLGQQFFTEREADAAKQIVVLIRVVQGKADDVFSEQPRGD